jgi:hypothetical protein
LLIVWIVTTKDGTSKALARSTSKQVDSQKGQQSVTEDRNGGAIAPSKASNRLRPWMELANLLPPPPSREKLERPASGLASMLNVETWNAEARATSPSELLRRFEGSELIQEQAICSTLDLLLLHTSESEAHRFHALVNAVASTLQQLVSAALPSVLKALGDESLMIYRLYENPATSRSEIWMHHGVVITKSVDPFAEFLRALEGSDISRVRQCPICNHFFWALRKDQKACSKKCNAVRRVRDWRANQEQHEYNRKLRGSGLLPQRKVKRRSSALPNLRKR